MELKLKKVDYHRNGVAGAPFYAVLFEMVEGGKKRNMVASVFTDKGGYCSVYDVDLLAKGSVTFGENSWRGDHFQEELMRLIKKHSSENE